jgi:hypothetical protein
MTVLRAAIIVAGLALAGGACGGDDDPLGDRAQFRAFPLYYVGDSFAGHRLHGERSDDGSDENSVNFIYGDCEPPEGEGGCPLPVQIENQRGCQPGSRPTRLLRIRGAPAAVFGVDDTLEIYTDGVTVRIHAEAGGELAPLRRVADALRSMDGRVKPGDPLPPQPARVRC